uniref:Ketoreductase (KR) domain-containing protein n=1 Tax=Clastoptera arizonana TaxID=38151 RepID=A0A1B6DNV6_9HEMI
MAFSTNGNCRRLIGKVAVITASTDGIGYAIAKRFAAEGASVLVSSRKETNVLKSVKSLKEFGYNVAGIVCHVGKQDDIKKLFQEAEHQFGGIDILVSNAAVNPAVGSLFETKTTS